MRESHKCQYGNWHVWRGGKMPFLTKKKKVKLGIIAWKPRDNKKSIEEFNWSKTWHQGGISDFIPRVRCSMITVTLKLLITMTVMNLWYFHDISFSLL